MDSLISWINKNYFYIMFYGSLLVIIFLYFIRCFFKNTNNLFDKFFKKKKTTEIKDVKDVKEKKSFMPKMSSGELRCKIYLEKIFNKPFNKIRPNFLKNNVTGYNLELDLYNEELGLAVEYNGEQHYKYTKGVHKNYEHFLNQKYRDEIKKMLCFKNNIVLIEVPFKVKEIEIFLYLKLKELKYDIYFDTEMTYENSKEEITKDEVLEYMGY